MAKLTATEVKEKWAKVLLTRGYPIVYREQELFFPIIYMREAGMDDLLSLEGKSDAEMLDGMLKMSVALSCDGCKLNADGTLSEPVFPDTEDILKIHLANVKRREVRPKDFKRMAEAFKAYNDLVEEDIKDFLTVPGMTKVVEKVESEM